MNNLTVIKSFALSKVNVTQCITARKLMAELVVIDMAWTKSDIKKAIIELSREGQIVEIELVFANGTNESIFVPKGTSFNFHKS